MNTPTLRFESSLTEVAGRLRASLDARLVDAVARHEGDGRPLQRADQRVLAASLAQRFFSDLAEERASLGQCGLSLDDEEEVLRAALDGLFGAGPLQPYLDDESVREVRVNGAGCVFVVRTDARKERVAPLVGSDDELIELVQGLARQAAGGAGGERRFDAAHPVLDLQLPGGHRLWAAREVTIAPCVLVRRHDFAGLVDLESLGRQGMFGARVSKLLTAAVRAKLNLIICGGTGVGKTTLLRALCNEVGPDERLVVIEDSPELGLDLLPELHPDLVTMCKREGNVEGAGAFGLPELVRAALRASPGRVIVGEVRGHEVLPMLLAQTQGNEGSLSTLHSRSSGDAFSRLAMYAAMSPEALSFEASAALITGALDLVIHLVPRPAGGPGRSPGAVASVREVVGHEGPRVASVEVLRSCADGALVAGADFSPETARRLAQAGFDREPFGEEPWSREESW